MPLRRKISLPKKFSGSTPGQLRPSDWNHMVDALSAIVTEITDLAPQSGADIGIRHTAGGWIAYLKRRAAGGGGAGAVDYIPWKPVFSVVDGVHKVRFNLGTLNGLLATNWDTLHTIGVGHTRFVVLNVSAMGDSGRVTSYAISLDTSPPPADNATGGTLPASFKITLGVIRELQAQFPVDYNLTAAGSIVFTQSIAPQTVGGEPFVRFWRWAVTQG